MGSGRPQDPGTAPKVPCFHFLVEIKMPVIFGGKMGNRDCKKLTSFFTWFSSFSRWFSCSWQTKTGKTRNSKMSPWEATTWPTTTTSWTSVTSLLCQQLPTSSRTFWWISGMCSETPETNYMRTRSRGHPAHDSSSQSHGESQNRIIFWVSVVRLSLQSQRRACWTRTSSWGLWGVRDSWEPIISRLLCQFQSYWSWKKMAFY